MVVIFGSFVALNLLISYISSLIIPFGSFPYKDIILNSHLPLFLSSFANFDGVHYLRIADFGYVNYEQAFFPLYPLLVHILNFLLSNLILSGLLLSFIAFYLSLIFFSMFLRQSGEKNINWVILLFLFFPTSFFFQSVYSESLFFLICAASLFFISKGDLSKGAILSSLASLCRLSGIFLLIPLLLKIVEQKKKGANTLYLLFPFLGVLTYSLYLNFKFGDPLLFYHVQTLFGAHRSTSGIILLPQIYIRYLKILLTLKFDLSYWISLFEFTTFNTIFWVLVYDLIALFKNKKLNMDRVGLNLFSFANILLPTLTGTLSSIPRYSLFALSFFVVLGNLKHKVLKAIILAIFAIAHVIALALFARGYFVS